jgi:hypothetical protein
MFDSETLRPVMIAMVVYLVLATIIPKIATKPTNIKLVDDLMMYIISQKGFLTSGVIFTGIVVYTTNYISLQMLNDASS